MGVFVLSKYVHAFKKLGHGDSSNLSTFPCQDKTSRILYFVDYSRTLVFLSSGGLPPPKLQRDFSRTIVGITSVVSLEGVHNRIIYSRALLPILLLFNVTI